MVSRGIRGQSVARPGTGDVLFGGFDDVFLSVDGYTGRVDHVPSRGRTVLFPWDEQRFLVLEEALGRLSQAVLSLRPLGEPREVLAAAAARDLPCSVGAEWGTEPVLVPGHFPVIFQAGGGNASMFTVEAVSGGDVMETFVPGVYSRRVPAVLDGRLEAFYQAGEVASSAAVPAVAAVGRGDAVWLVADGGLTIVAGEAPRHVAPPDPERWLPQTVEHDPSHDRVLVASWNRWGSLGGPSSDLFVFTGDGLLAARGHAQVLVERMALSGEGMVVVDVQEGVHVCDLSVP